MKRVDAAGQGEAYRATIVPAATDLAALAEESYKLGRNPLLALLDAQRSFRDVQREYLQSLFDFQLAVADLAAATGGESFDAEKTLAAGGWAGPLEAVRRPTAAPEPADRSFEPGPGSQAVTSERAELFGEAAAGSERRLDRLSLHPALDGYGRTLPLSG